MNKIPFDARTAVYEDAIERYGSEHQIVVAIEEMSEVIKSLTKWLRRGSDSDLDSIVEEVADATIMFEQLRLIFDINDEVCEAMDKKIERLRKRVKEEHHA